MNGQADVQHSQRSDGRMEKHYFAHPPSLMPDLPRVTLVTSNLSDLSSVRDGATLRTVLLLPSHLWEKEELYAPHIPN